MSKNEEALEFMEKRQFKEAVQILEEEYLLTKDEITLRNKITALINLKDYRMALNCCKQLICIREKNSVDLDYIYAGACYWMLEDTLNAIKMWIGALKCKYSDAVGGVEAAALLYFGAVRLKDDKLKKKATDFLKKRWHYRESINWPGMIAGYLLNELNDENILVPQSKHSSIQRRQMCKAEFYIAVKFLEKGDMMGYITYLAETLSYYAYFEPEYCIAVYELEKNKNYKANVDNIFGLSNN